MKEIPVSELSLNPMTKIAKEWMLVTAGTEATGWNTMTASWGHLGSLWGLYTAICYVRPQRYTREFIDREPYYTLTFFAPEHKKALGYLGTKSGRDEDKVANVGFHPVFGENYTTFEEAELTLVCRKIYQAPIEEKYFADKEVLDNAYPKRDFHDLYVGEIVKVLVKD